MRDPFNLLVAGVGGQGNLVCGRVLADAAIHQGLRPVVGDTFGASRRGGSVLTHLRLGKIDWAPLIPQGEVDIILGLEPLETLRAAQDYAGERTTIIMSLSKIPPVGTKEREMDYPSVEKIVEALESTCKRVYAFDTDVALQEIGTKRVMNAFMLGAFSAVVECPFNENTIRDSFESVLGKDLKNLQAFKIGAQQTKDL